jgi:guanylate kinase
MSLGKLVLLIGPSGVGKSVILKKLRTRHPDYVFPRSATTRPRRPGEGNELYHFITEEDFTQWIDEGKFLEWAQVHHGARYGTLLSEILPAIETGKTVVREVDVQGFESIRIHPEFSGASPKHHLQTIFILPENEEQLITRIKNRAPISDAELKNRVSSMKQELATADHCDVRIRNIEGKLNVTIADVEKAIAK